MPRSGQTQCRAKLVIRGQSSQGFFSCYLPSRLLIKWTLHVALPKRRARIFRSAQFCTQRLPARASTALFRQAPSKRDSPPASRPFGVLQGPGHNPTLPRPIRRWRTYGSARHKQALALEFQAPPPVAAPPGPRAPEEGPGPGKPARYRRYPRHGPPAKRPARIFTPALRPQRAYRYPRCQDGSDACIIPQVD